MRSGSERTPGAHVCRLSNHTSRVALHPLPRFHNRSSEVSRLEGLSDAVFGFAITLLVVSLSVPTHFDELIQQLRNLPVFAVTFAVVASIWYSQYMFFRRYGLNDFITILLNLVLLFVVLFYVYPLKFLFGVALQVNGVTIRDQDLPLLLLIYGVGFAAVSFVLALMNLRAYRLGDELALTPWERYLTRMSIANHLAHTGLGLASALIAQAGQPYTSLAAWMYFGAAVPPFVLGWMRGHRARAMAAASNAA